MRRPSAQNTRAGVAGRSLLVAAPAAASTLRDSLGGLALPTR